MTTSSSRLHVETQQRPHVVILSPDGDVDVESYDTFRSALAEATAAGRANVVVDLAKVRYIDSMGLGALVSSLRSANEHGCAISLVCCTPHLWRVLQVTGLSQLFPIFHDREEALGEEPSARL